MQIKVIVDKKRQWQIIREADKIAYLLNEKIHDKVLYLKGTTPPVPFTFTGLDENKNFAFVFSEDINPGNKFTLYTTVKRQIEFDFESVTFDAGQARVLPVEARIGTAVRSYERISIENGLIYADNFRISKNEMIPGKLKPSVANQVIFKEFEQSLSSQFPGIKIYDAAVKEKPEETKYCSKLQPALITDTGNPAAYAPGPEFVDLSKATDFESLKKRLRDKKIGSTLIVPIIYEGPAEDIIVIAYMITESKDPGLINEQTYIKWKDIAPQVTGRILDANTVQIRDKQKVINISEGGVAIEITNPELKKYVPLRSWITFDLVFKMQAPLRFMGRLCHIHDTGNFLIAGVDLEGTGHSAFKRGPKERLKQLLTIVTQKK